MFAPSSRSDFCSALQKLHDSSSLSAPGAEKICAHRNVLLCWLAVDGTVSVTSSMCGHMECAPLMARDANAKSMIRREASEQDFIPLVVSL